MKVLVAVDGSPASLRAVDFALQLAKTGRQPCVVLANVQNFGTLGLSEGAALLPEGWEEKAADTLSRKQLRKAAEICRKAKVATEICAETGPVAETVIRIARKTKAEHIVLGTRGLGAVRGLLLGSTTTKVVHLADLPVTLIK